MSIIDPTDSIGLPLILDIFEAGDDHSSEPLDVVFVLWAGARHWQWMVCLGAVRYSTLPLDRAPSAERRTHTDSQGKDRL